MIKVESNISCGVNTNYASVLKKLADELRKSEFDTETKKQKYAEVKYLLSGLDPTDSKPQIIGGLRQDLGWYLVDPKTLKAVDVDGYINHYLSTHEVSGSDYFDFYDKIEADPQKYWKDAKKESLIQNLTDLF